MPFPLPPDMSKDFCINPLIKITIQSKDLFTIALHCTTVPNAASERQTLPPLYNRLNLMSSLPLNVDRQAGRQPVLQDEQTAHIQDGRLSCLQDCRNARKQERRNDGKRNSLLSDHHACVIDGMTNGTNARTQSRLIGCLNESIAAVQQESRQSAIPAGKPDSYPARKTARNQDCTAESLQD